jgi:hypothetical protein
MTLAAVHPLHDTLRDYQRDVIDSTWAHLILRTTQDRRAS